MNTTTLIIVAIVFTALIITALIGVIVYMLFFKKVSVVIFGSNGIPNEISKAKKKKNRLYFDKGINFEIVNNYISKGKKRIYFAQKINERTFVPFVFVNTEDDIKNIEVDYNNKAEKKEFDKKLKLDFSKKYHKLIKTIDTIQQQIEYNQLKLDTQKQKIENGNDKLLFIDRNKFIIKFSNNIKQLNIKLSRFKKLEEKLRKEEEIKFNDLCKKEKQKIKYTVQNNVNTNYNILNGIADSYEEGAIRFKFGLDKFAPFITIALVALICVLGVAISMKYATQITPVEAEAIQDMSQS